MAIAGEGITVSEAGIKRHIRHSVSDHTAFVLVRAQGGVGDLTAAVESAVAAANDGAHGKAANSVAQGQNVFQTANGVMFYLQTNGEMDDVRGWLSIARDTLGRAGWRGTILAPSDSWGPTNAHWFTGGMYRPWTATLFLTPTRRSTHAPEYEWSAPDHVTREVADHATAWTNASAGTNYLLAGAGQYQVGPVAPPAELLGAVLERSGQVRISKLGLKPLVERSVRMSAGTRVSFGVRGVDESWRDSIRSLRECLIALGHSVECGWVTYGSDNQESVEGRSQSSRGLLQGEWQNNRHMWTTHLPDAFGIQVVTSAHLERFRYLEDGWNVTSVGNDRYLVEAKNLEPWFAQPEPVNREFARMDMSGLILTEDAIRSDPLGWLHGDGYKPTVYL